MNKFKTYVISSETSADKRNRINSIQPKLGLQFEFFNRVTADEITQEVRKHFDSVESRDNIDDIIVSFMTHTKLLMECVMFGDNLLIIEDTVDIVREVDWEDIDFTQFDVLNLTAEDDSAYAYFVSFDGAHKILSILDQDDLKITQPWNQELYKMSDRIDYKYVAEPVFVKI